MEDSSLYLFFAGLGPGWVNAATVISAIFGIGFSFFAFFYSKKSNDKSALLIEEIKKTAVLTHQNADLANKNTRILRLDNLRILYELSSKTDSHLYWRFRWRFETFDCLRIRIFEKKENDERNYLGFCEILIEGFSNPSDLAGFERKDSEFYKVKIRDFDKNSDHFPFQLNDFAACFCGNNEMQISKGLDPWTEHPKYCFELGGLGHMKFSHGDPIVDEIKPFSRIKDT